MFTPDQWLAIFTLLAVLLSPIFALEVQKRLDDRRGIRERKMAIFRKLMTTRATQLAPAHVEALNGIEVEFYATGGPDKKVLDAWRLYVNHLNTKTGEGEALNRWVEKKTTLLTDLLYAMAQNLGYDIDKVAIQNNAYHPKGFVEIETEQHALRKATLAVFSGERPIQTTVVGRVQTTQPLPLPAEINPPAIAVRQPALVAPKPAVSRLPTIQAEVVPEGEKR
jgi:Family of unknown function (DUF6680)